jgi:hypothetical protein
VCAVVGYVVFLVVLTVLCYAGGNDMDPFYGGVHIGGRGPGWGTARYGLPECSVLTMVSSV